MVQLHCHFNQEKQRPFFSDRGDCKRRRQLSKYHFLKRNIFAKRSLEVCLDSPDLLRSNSFEASAPCPTHSSAVLVRPSTTSEQYWRSSLQSWSRLVYRDNVLPFAPVLLLFNLQSAFNAANNVLPFHRGPPLLGGIFTGPASKKGGVFFVAYHQHTGVAVIGMGRQLDRFTLR